MKRIACVMGLPVLILTCGAAPAGDPQAVALCMKAVQALGGKEGLRKRRNLFTEQELRQNLPGKKEKFFTARVLLYQKGDKRRMEQYIGRAPGPATVVIYDGKDLFLPINGERREAGAVLKKTFEANKKREDLWWDCLTKPFRLQFLGKETFRKKDLFMIKFIHGEGDVTFVGLDPTTSLPHYCKWKGPHPYTGKKVWWIQWYDQFRPMPKAGNLLFPVRGTLYEDDKTACTFRVRTVEYRPSLPDSLFGVERPVD